ncbi:hypothetical protein V5799_021656 [Amblyomma americanum]|uniref:Uncharacterized protein n=1 Tax=Amblyomma americanum TaxID=6943 RepID=A0AAQ4FMU9_AMBAM
MVACCTQPDGFTGLFEGSLQKFSRRSIIPPQHTVCSCTKNWTRMQRAMNAHGLICNNHIPTAEKSKPFHINHQPQEENDEADPEALPPRQV